MAPHFPYLAASIATASAGALTSVVWAAQLPPHAPAVGGASLAGMAGPPVVTRPAVVANTANTPGSSPSQPTPSAQGFFAPGNVAQIVGAPANPGAAQAPGLTQASQFSQAGMNQPGQPPFGEMLYSMQTYMNQPGAPDFYQQFNPTVVGANEGVTPSAAYPNPTTPQTGVPSSTTVSLGSATTQAPPGTVGFFNGFGPGQPNFGFFAGFTTPR
jgi:hypothetical protein